MKPAKKKELLTKLRVEIKKAKEMAAKKKKAARVFKVASRSQQGDKLYYENAFYMAQDHLLRLLEFEKEVTSTEEKTPDRVEPISFVTVEYMEGGAASFYFVKTGLRLAETILISPGSPLGQAIEEKKEGESFSYQVETDDRTISRAGKIRKIE